VIQLKDENTFRFSLQFSRSTEEQIRVGELLERMGNKKSRFIVQVINEYITAHPELTVHGDPVQIQVSSSGFTREDLRKLIAELLAERGYISDNSVGLAPKDGGNSASASIEEMLDNLNMFD